MEFHWKKKRKEKKGNQKRKRVDLWIPACFLVAMCTMQVFSLYLPEPLGSISSLLLVYFLCARGLGLEERLWTSTLFHHYI
jgi:hypothetical protein